MEKREALEIPGINTALAPGSDLPEYLLATVADFRKRYGNLKWFDEWEVLATDPRMRDFWAWLRTVRYSKLDTLRNARTVADAIVRSTKMPGKPGNMSPAVRNRYFERVRKSALELKELLADTRFDRCSGIGGRELTEDDLDMPLTHFLALRGLGDRSGDGPETAVVAFEGDASGAARELDWNYPASALTATLADVYEWTFWDDQWDDGIFSSSAPIVQAGTDRARTNYFTCMLYRSFERHGVGIPFPLLATVANVALRLPPESQLDEDAARKQVRRFQVRLRDAARDWP
jgi:hypothetical protein